MSARNASSKFVLFLSLLFIALLPACLAAQTSGTSGLSGTVTDQTGASIANATVTVTNVANGQNRTTMTKADGTYQFSLLSPGTYTVKFEATGFQTAEAREVQLNVTESPVLNRSLLVGAQNALVTVQADTETVETESSTLGTVVAQKAVTDLPLSTRNFINLISLSAGANASVNNANQPGKGSTFLFVNGQNDEQNNYQMDGATVNNFFSFGTANDNGFYAAIPTPSPDAIQEFKIQTSTYDAGYGRNPGANVNVVTRAGTNSFHGSGFEFFRNTALNANEYFYKQTELQHGQPNKAPVMLQNQFGGTIGGPIKKDKLFVFGSYQETRQKNGLTAFGLQSPILPPIPAGNRGTCTTPNWTSLAQCDSATASFVTALATAISPNPGCPANSLPASKLSSYKTQVTGGINIACPNAPLTGSNSVTGPTGLYNINPVAINILQLKLPNGSYYVPQSTSGDFQSNTYSIPATYKEHQAQLNLDYQINSKHTLSERYIYSTDPSTGPFPCGLQGSNICIPGGPVAFQYWQNVGTVRLTSLLTNNLVNEAHFALQRYVSHTSNGIPFTNAQVGITGLNPALPQMSQIAITNQMQFGGATLFGLSLANQQYEIGDQISWTHGKHTFRFGGEWERDFVTITISGLGLGNPSFGSFPDFLIGRCSGASPTPCALSNGGTSSNESNPGTGIVGYDGRFTSKLPVSTVSLFAQDDVKVTPNLTLNLGLRWEWFGQVETNNGEWSNTWASLIRTAPDPGSGCIAQGGVAAGLGASGTGCSLVGFEVPSNYTGPVPTGVYQSNLPYITQHGGALSNFAPRVGFAWQPFPGKHLAVRGGGGYFYDRPNGIPVTESGHSNPPYTFGVAQNNLETLSNPFVVPPTLPGPAGTPGWTPRWVTPAGLSSNLSGNQTLDEKFSNGLVYEWNISTQYEFRPSWVLELGYVGTRGIRLTAGTSGGNGIVGNTTLGGNSPSINMAQLASVASPVNCYADIGGCVTTNTTGNVNLRVPYLGMSSGWAPVTNNGSTKYNSLQITVRKQLSHGLTAQAAYTYSRSFNNYYVGNALATAPGIQPYLNVYGPNTGYRPNRLVFSYNWDLPLGKHQGVVGQMLNGWSWSGVTTIQDGQPLVITNSNEGTAFVQKGAGGPIALATLCPGFTNATAVTSGSLISRINGGYFNTAAFAGGAGSTCAVPTIAGGGTGYGDYGIGHLSGPGQNNWDITFSKVFRIRESQSFQFRTEFFNAFNHPQFNNPFQNAALPSFGTFSGTSVNPRLIQFAVKYLF